MFGRNLKESTCLILFVVSAFLAILAIPVQLEHTNCQDTSRHNVQLAALFVWLTGDLKISKARFVTCHGGDDGGRHHLTPLRRDRSLSNSRHTVDICRSWGQRQVHWFASLQNSLNQLESKKTGQIWAVWSIFEAARSLAGIHDVAVRNGFVRKVFSILTVQLLITTAIAASQLGVARVAPDILWYLLIDTVLAQKNGNDPKTSLIREESGILGSWRVAINSCERIQVWLGLYLSVSSRRKIREFHGILMCLLCSFFFLSCWISMQHHATIVRSNVFFWGEVSDVWSSVFRSPCLELRLRMFVGKPRCMAGKKPQRLAASQLHSFDEKPKSWRHEAKPHETICCWSSTHLRSLHWEINCILMCFDVFCKEDNQVQFIFVVHVCFWGAVYASFIRMSRIVHLPQKFFGNAAQMDSHGIELWGKARRVRFWNCSVFLLSNAH